LIISAIIACIIGILQFFNLYFIFRMIMKKSYAKGIALMLFKIMIYTVVMILIIKLFPEYTISSFIGFEVGYMTSLIIYAIRAISSLKGGS